MKNATRKENRNVLMVILFLCMTVCSSSSAQKHASDGYHGPKENLHIYLLLGQSNMAGRAPFSKEEAGVIPQCYLPNNEDKWEAAKNPLNRYSTIMKRLGKQKLNPGYTYAKTMLKNQASISIGLIVNARGSTSIKQWAKGSHFYNRAAKVAVRARRATA